MHNGGKNKMNNRKDMNTRRHYGMIEICYNCPGTKEIADNCDLGTNAYMEEYKMCAWKKTVDNDLEKIAKNKDILTFPVLRKIIQRKVVEQIKWENGK